MILAKNRRLIPLCVIILFIAGCSSVGPKNMVRDRSAYINAISDSWKNQLLLNIVKLRYADAPVFLDISNIVNSYEIRGQVNAGAGLESKGAGFMPYLGSEASFTDKPTVSYAPMSGNKFAMSLMNPIGIPTVLGLVYAGYPVDLIFSLTLTSINGINNKFTGSMRKTEGSPEFYRLLEILRRLQGSNILSINVTNQKDIMINFALGDPADSSMLQYPGAAQDIKEVAKILGIDFLKQTYKVDYGTRPGDSNHILMKTRSLLEILTEISNTVEVPEEHLLEFQTIPTSLVLGPDGAVTKPLLVIHSSKDEPLSAFFSISYNDYWFYLDKNDYNSKKVFSFLLFLCALSDTDDQKSSPVLTIPAN